MLQLRNAGLTLRAIVEQLNAEGFVSVRADGLCTAGPAMSLHRAWMLFVGLLLVVGTLGCGVRERAPWGHRVAVEWAVGRAKYEPT